MLPHLSLYCSGAVRKLGDVTHGGNVPGQPHPAEQGAVVLENAVQHSENKTSCYNICQLVINPLYYLCEILMVGDKTMETFWSVILFIFS